MHFQAPLPFCIFLLCFSEQKDGLWGFIDKEETIIVPIEYEAVEANYIDGVGRLMKNNIIYSFDIKGNQIDSYEQDNKDDNYGGYNDEPSIYDNPYYDDNLDMDQQSIEFWNSL